MQERFIQALDDIHEPTTAQLIKSPSRAYRIVWAQPLAEEPRCEIQSLSASSCMSESSEDTNDVQEPSFKLDRVNNKLEEWFCHRGRGAGRESDDMLDRHCHDECRCLYTHDNTASLQLPGAIDDASGANRLRAPPNSKRDSQGSTRMHSYNTRLTSTLAPERLASTVEHPATRRQSRYPITEGYDDGSRVGQLIGASSRQRIISDAARRLSNLAPEDMHFGDHRDSLVLARKRLLHVGEISVELLVRQDSLVLARNRMRRHLRKIKPT